MDTFVDSSWYFYRYPDAHNASAPFQPAEDRLLVSHRPVHRRGGARHPAPDLLALLDQGDARPRPDQATTSRSTRLFTQGMVIRNGAKMSKSKGNVVSPDEMIARYGADATRMYALFAAPPDRDLDWQEDGVAGVSRFLGRVYRLGMRYRESVRGQPGRVRRADFSTAPRRCCASCTRPSARSPRILPGAGTSTPASPRSWSWSTRSPPPSPDWLRCRPRSPAPVDGHHPAFADPVAGALRALSRGRAVG